MDKPPYRVDVKPPARKALRRIRDQVQDHINEAIDDLAYDPTPPPSAPLVRKAQGMRRLKGGEYRVVYHTNHV